MTSIQQREQLQSQIWKIANEVRGAVDGWDFKQFVLGTLFYRFISENFTDYIEGGDDSVDYASLPDSIITPEIKEDAVKTKGYFIYPSQLFVNVVKTANTNPNLNTDLKAIFDSIESIIRKTKRFAIPERAVYFLKTKRTAGGTPPPQNIFDRLTPVFT